MIKTVIPQETQKNETRVAGTPETVRKNSTLENEHCESVSSQLRRRRPSGNLNTTFISCCCVLWRR